MPTVDPGSTAGLRDQLLSAAGAEASPQLRGLLAAYLAPVPEPDLPEIDPVELAALAQAQLAAGRHRRPGQHLVEVFTPDTWDAHGSSVVLIVTDDRPFLVDTAVLELTSQDWSLRQLYHPQPQVRRTAEGELIEVGTGQVESWIALEVYPPLGSSAAELGPQLTAGLERALATVAVVVDDWQPMLTRCRDAITELKAGQQRPDAGEAVELLDWLAGEHFVFLGYAAFASSGSTLSPVAGSGLGLLRGEVGLDPVAAPEAGEQDVLVLFRDQRRSPVYRPAYLTQLVVRQFAADGTLHGEHRFLGLLGAAAYTESVASIPVLAAKSRRLLAGCGFEPNSYGWNATRQVIADYPRDELFEAGVDELSQTIAAVAALRGRRRTRVFLRRSRHGGFVTALVFLPRDRFNTETRLRIQEILLAELGGVELEYATLVSESVLTRLFFVVRLGAQASATLDAARIEGLVSRVTTSWDDEFSRLAASLPSEQRGVEFGEVYEADHPPAVALAHLELANQLTETDSLRVTIADPADADDPADLRLTVLSLEELPLIKVMPHLTALGSDVVDERPYEWDLRGTPVRVYAFGLRLAGEWTADTRARFAEAFVASWTDLCEADQLNQLVILAGLSWRQVSWLRAVSRYLQQAGLSFSQPYLAAALVANPSLAAGLAEIFATKFDPNWSGADGSRAETLAGLEAQLTGQLDAVASLDHDRILRAFAAVIHASVRTNAFTDSPTIALKLLPAELELLPAPRPEYEVFVYSPRVHGVHLRFGPVARGGLRWSDRPEDFRTEVLGLVKAQLVKNTVIVPVGAKGGFVPQRLPDPRDRAAWLAEGVACYRLFVAALLSVTDNIVDQQVIAPPGVLCYDGEDPYLVVAADKGTATFSDYANEISAERGFWLGDAFASGGSAGYDHKVMGITARGAWESVKRHFAEMGLDPARDEFTCVGIGDMAGDVFGNGMLASDRLRLVAAFNHVHIFIDPDPDPAASFAERRRLFALPGSTWADHQGISAGGGVFRRDAKSVPIGPEIRRVLGLDEQVVQLTPNELVASILRAPVDLLFNGGVGTFVKASTETSAQVGDKANDALRVDGRELRARCVAEGGNLGFTQAGRIEYAQAGGRINTDFIDNSAGVDTSDHEVNIKILLSSAPSPLSGPERQELLASMTDEVAALVLSHNFDQNLALANAMYRRFRLAGQHEEWMRVLEADGLLDRHLEGLPGSAEMAARIAAGSGLTRPELAVLLSYTKIALKRWVLASDLPDDPYLADRLVQYFPEPLRQRYAAVMPSHRLARQIITTVAVNRFVNSQGITAYHRLSTETGAEVADIIRAQLASRAIFNVGLDEVRLRRLNGLTAELGTELRVVLLRMVERATRWLLHRSRGSLDIVSAIEEYGPAVAALRPRLPELLTGADQEAAARKASAWLAAGVPEELARPLGAAGQAHTLLSIVQVGHRLGRDPLEIAELHYAISGALGLDLLFGGVDELPRQVRWDAMARAALRDELLAAHADLTEQLASRVTPGTAAEQALSAWLSETPQASARIAMIRQVAEGTPDVAKMNVGLGQVRSLLAECR
ncbi:glutamate dehydrogenase (NAD) [Propionicimonas paludicola]|uniref:Glutamate dehydrogenase (NAD) n=1 Tax=Propionicimonas paludicola TaxID=185243 RepID=A0A2A9CR67_9ACTN|nr:NAD-glutamate dehydrogenase [Propionicimonas paludicola]PFG16903.1 glutamate dehydrogenase (NAD) [Propionicimonas paludicola]